MRQTAQRRAVKFRQTFTPGPRAYHGPRPDPCSSGMQAAHRGKTSPSSAAQLPVDAALNARSLTLLIFSNYAKAIRSGGRPAGGGAVPCPIIHPARPHRKPPARHFYLTPVGLPLASTSNRQPDACCMTFTASAHVVVVPSTLVTPWWSGLVPTPFLPTPFSGPPSQ